MTTPFSAKLFLWTGILWVGCGYVFSAQLQPAQVVRLGRSEGLSHTVVRAIVQDNQGFMWFGTANGLNRYDGLRFLSFNKDDGPRSLSGNEVGELFADPRGFVWIGTNVGLDRYDPDTQQITHFGKFGNGVLVPEDAIKALAQTSDLNLWVGTSGGLTRISPTMDKVTTFEHPLLEGGVSALTPHDTNRIWVGTGQGRLLLFDLKTESFDRLSIFDKLGLEDSAIETLHQDNKGYIWVGMSGAGVLAIHPKSNETTPPSEVLRRYGNLSERSVEAIATTEEGDIWLGGDQASLYYSPSAESEFEPFEQGPILRHHQVYTLFQDRTGLMWVGTSDGVYQFAPQSHHVTTYQSHADDPHALFESRVKSIWEGKDGRLWIGTYSGLEVLDRTTEKFKHYHHDPLNPQSISHDTIFSLVEDEEGRLWVATHGGGLNLFNNKTETFRHFREGQGARSIHHDSLVHVSLGPNGRLWLGARKGMCLFDPATETWTPMGVGGPGDDYVRTIAPGPIHRWWIGTYSNGIYLYDDQAGSFQNFRNDPQDPTSLIDSNVQTILQDQAGRLWVGTMRGLDQYQPTTNTFRHYQVADGLPSNVISAILEDQGGYLWVSTDNGLCRFDPNQGSFISYGVRQGIVEHEFNLGAARSLAGGEVAFGGMGGLTLFPPNSMVSKTVAPLVALTSFKVRGKEIPLLRVSGELEQLVVDQNDRAISFDFAALDYNNPSKNTYAHRLQGFEEEWQDIGNRNFASYTNLDAGQYTFQVKATNGEGVWSEAPAGINLLVRPSLSPNQGYFLLTGLCLALGLYYWVMRTIRKRNRLNRVIQDRTESLEASNRELQATAENLRNTQKRLLDSAHKVGMAEIASDVLHNMGNALNGIMVSATVVDKHIDAFKIARLKRLSDLLSENQANLSAFLEEQGRGAMVVEMLTRLSEDLESSRSSARQEIRELHARGLEMVAILRYQRKYALGEEFYEEVRLSDMLEHVLQIQSASLDELAVRVIRLFDPIPLLFVPRSKLLNVFNHLIKNSVEALALGAPRGQRTLTLTLKAEPYHVFVSIQDNGVGIKPELLEKIFTAGFSTKANSAGIGLHHCANSLAEIGGTMYALSEGEGAGATFCLEIPLELQMKSKGEIA